MNPELSQWYSILNENKLVSKSILNRGMYRNELINTAKDYTQNILGLICPDIDCENIVVTGHQPIWHHCGIWSKDVIAQRFAQSVKGIALHLVLDHDICDTSMILPKKDSDENWGLKKIEIEPDNTRKAEPLEFRSIPKKKNIISFLKQIIDENNNQICNRFWLDCKLPENSSFNNIADLITYLQAILNSALGLDILYMPVSSLCASNAFQSFVCSIISDSENFAHCYNQGITSLCKINVNKRGKSVKLLVVDRDSSLVELPFWLVSEKGRLSSLWVTRKNKYIEVSTKQNALGNIDSSLEGNTVQLQELLDCNNFKLRPKAITLTLFSRLFLADIFVHGVGAKYYEPITDYLLKHYYGISPLKYGIATSTMTVPFLNKQEMFQKMIYQS